MEMENQSKNGFCEIKIKGKLEPNWAEWFELMNIAIESDNTVISGFVIDQPALQGLMEKISMLGLKVISINFASSDKTNLENDFK